MRKPVCEAGFTLVETLVGIAILSGVLIAASSALSSSLAIATRVLARKDAVDTLERELAKLRTQMVVPGYHATGVIGSYRWSLNIDALSVPVSRRYEGPVPLRAIGRLAAKDDHGPHEVVLDRVLMRAAKR